jgi:hypothetical protein
MRKFERFLYGKFSLSIKEKVLEKVKTAAEEKA